MRFLKMHGAGNDFVVVDRRAGEAPLTAEVVYSLGDRHRGVGFDQLAELSGPEDDLHLAFWNADGSRAGACGNATRCVADLVMTERDAEKLTLTTARGALSAIRDSNGAIWVNMGQPQLDWRDIPLSDPVDTLHLPLDGDPAACGMGNPHCIFFVPDVSSVDVAGQGANLEHHPLFPDATNVEFVEVLDHQNLRLRVWERGTGITLACGSGTCAAVVSAVRRGFTDRRVDVLVDGGTLRVDWQDDGVWLTGPTARVFEGELSPEFLGSVK